MNNDETMQRLRAKLEPIIDDHGHAAANGANRKPTNTRTIDAILQALAAEIERAEVGAEKKGLIFGFNRLNNMTKPELREAYHKRFRELQSKTGGDK